MFSLEKKLAKIKSVSPVAEFKGDGRDHGQSVKVEIACDNGILSEFDSQLRRMLYQKEDGPRTAPDGQQEMSLPRADSDGLTKLRAPIIKMPLKLDKDYAGYKATYHPGASEKADIPLIDVKLSDFTIDAKEGGTVLLCFTMYAKPNAPEAGKIEHMLQTEVELSLEPPSETQAELPGTAPARKSKAAKGAAPGQDPFEGSDLARKQPEPEPA